MVGNLVVIVVVFGFLLQKLDKNGQDYKYVILVGNHDMSKH